MKIIRHTTVIQSSVLSTLLLILLGWPSAMQAATLDSGIGGQTLIHVARVANIITGQAGSTAPFHASLRVYSVGSNRLVTTITTDAEGRFQIQLRPGYYRVVPDTMWQGRVLQADEIVVGSYDVARPVNVRVRPHRLAPLTITYERMMGF